MIPYLVATAIVGQADARDIPPLWRTIARSRDLKKVKTWQADSVAIDKRITYLRFDSKSSRETKLLRIGNSCITSRDTPQNAILYVRLYENFRNELESTRIHTRILTSITNALGIPDPDFMREIYTFSYLNGEHWDCGSVGRSLMKIYPKDLDLQRAFLRDCAQGHATLEDRYYAAKLIPSWKGKLSNWDYHDLYAGITYTITTISKRSNYVAEAKREIRAAIKHAPTEPKRKFKQSMLDHLNRDYPNIK